MTTVRGPYKAPEDRRTYSTARVPMSCREKRQLERLSRLLDVSMAATIRSALTLLEDVIVAQQTDPYRHVGQLKIK